MNVVVGWCRSILHVPCPAPVAVIVAICCVYSFARYAFLFAHRTVCGKLFAPENKQ